MKPAEALKIMRAIRLHADADRAAAMAAFAVLDAELERLGDIETRRDETLEWLRGRERRGPRAMVAARDAIDLLVELPPLTPEERELEQ